MTRLPRPLYIVARFLYLIAAAFSRLFNSAVLGGSTHQTTSARAYMESRTSAKWDRWRRRIDAVASVVFWDQDHCEGAWLSEVENAERTLDQAMRLTSEAE